MRTWRPWCWTLRSGGPAIRSSCPGWRPRRPAPWRRPKSCWRAWAHSIRPDTSRPTADRWRSCRCIRASRTCCSRPDRCIWPAWPARSPRCWASVMCCEERPVGEMRISGCDSTSCTDNMTTLPGPRSTARPANGSSERRTCGSGNSPGSRRGKRRTGGRICIRSVSCSPWPTRIASRSGSRAARRGIWWPTDEARSSRIPIPLPRNSISSLRIWTPAPSGRESISPLRSPSATLKPFMPAGSHRRSQWPGMTRRRLRGPRGNDSWVRWCCRSKPCRNRILPWWFRRCCRAFVRPALRLWPGHLSCNSGGRGCSSSAGSRGRTRPGRICPTISCWRPLRNGLVPTWTAWRPWSV